LRRLRANRLSAPAIQMGGASQIPGGEAGATHPGYRAGRYVQPCPATASPPPPVTSPAGTGAWREPPPPPRDDEGWQALAGPCATVAQPGPRAPDPPGSLNTHRPGPDKVWPPATTNKPVNQVGPPVTAEIPWSQPTGSPWIARGPEFAPTGPTHCRTHDFEPAVLMTWQDLLVQEPPRLPKQVWQISACRNPAVLGALDTLQLPGAWQGIHQFR